MERLFQVVLSLSVSGSLVGLLLLLFRPITKPAFSKRWTYYLWLLVIVRLLLPVHADINLMEYLSGRLSAAAESRQVGTGIAEAGESVEMLHGKADRVQEQEMLVNGQDGVGITEIGRTRTNSVTEGESMETASVQTGNESSADAAVTGKNSADRAAGFGAKGWTAVGAQRYFLRFTAIVWVCGAVFAILRKLIIYRRFTREIGASCVKITDQRVLIKSGEIRFRLGINRDVPLYECGCIDSPMLVGLCRPRICLPSALLAELDGRENDICLILHHELVHYKRKDIWYKWLFQAALCVHWFNPLVYVFNGRFNIDCELACDEMMLKLLSEGGRRTYGNVLLNVAQKNWFGEAFSGKDPGVHRNVPMMTLLEEKSTLKERLRGIARYHKTGMVLGLCSAAVLVMFLALALVCGVAGVRAGSGETSAYGTEEFSDDTGLFGLSFLKENLFAPDQSIFVSRTGDAYRMYDNDMLIAGDSESDLWRAWDYCGGEERTDVQKFMLNGSDTLWILYANKETTLEISSGFDLRRGRFKIVWVSPNQTVQTLNEGGEENTVTITLPEGRNMIKMVGQRARLEELSVAYGGMKTEDFDSVYMDENVEYAYQVLEGKRPFDLSELDEICPFLEADEVSRLYQCAWQEGAVLSEVDWQELFAYSDKELTGQYLLEELQAGRIAEFNSGILVEIAPCMTEEDVSECFRCLLERDAVDSSDYEDIFLFSDSRKSAEYLAGALREGKVSGFSDKALRQICYQMSTKVLTDIVTAMGKDELSFVGLEEVLSFVQKQDEAVDCICHYIDLGNVLTDAQLEYVEPYVAEEDFYRVIEYNGKKKFTESGKEE